MTIERERLIHLWLKDWRRKLEADDFSDPETIRTHLVEVHRLLLEIACPRTMSEARASLRAFYENQTVEGDEIPGPPACVGGGCGED